MSHTIDVASFKIVACHGGYRVQHVATALRIGAKQGVQKQSASVGVAVQQSLSGCL